jgi:hypothetical protein
MPENLTKEEELAKAANAEHGGKELLELAANIRKKHGVENNGGGDGVAAAGPDEIERLAKEWDSLTQAERMRQYTEEPEKWRKGKEAFEALGVRRLLNKR